MMMIVLLRDDEAVKKEKILCNLIPDLVACIKLSSFSRSRQLQTISFYGMEIMNSDFVQISMCLQQKVNATHHNTNEQGKSTTYVYAY